MTIDEKLFKPLKVGRAQLQHRVVMAPLTRFRADDDLVPMPMVKEYYLQRACIPGTLIISEACQISPCHIGRDNAPGIWSEAQIAAWKEIVSAVHSKGCYIYCQLWAQGWAASPETLAKHGLKMMTADGTKMPGTEIPEEMVHTMTEEDIQETILAYVTAAQNAIMAGFDGIEIHGGNGYLPDQFLQTSSNSKRTDKWGGSIENRTRFTVEIVNAIAGAIGADRSALRLSPWSDFNFMGQMTDEEVFKTFVHLIQTLRPLGLSWLDLIEPRIRGNDDAPCGVGQSIEFLVRAWDGASPIIWLFSEEFLEATASKAAQG